jgi:hypothetical protein
MVLIIGSIFLNTLVEEIKELLLVCLLFVE